MAGNVPPPKPREQSGAPSGSTPFKPPSAGSTTQVVETSGTSRPGEIVSTSDSTTTINRKPVGRPLPTRPWEQTYGSSCHYGGYGSAWNYNSGFNSRLYGSYGGLGGVYGNNMYRGGYGVVYGSGMYGCAVYGVQDPSSPFGASPSSPGFWISVVRVVQGVVNFVDRVSMLIPQNTHAFPMFITALFFR
ncbi:hypothetical protein PTKIN_Ptkin09bG0268700 [Pterospermum kingtungense]